MILCDVNVYLFGYFEQSAHHEVCHEQLLQLLSSSEPFAVSELILAAVVRIGSNPKLFKPAPAADDLFAFCQTWLDDPRAVSVQPGARHWRIFRDLVDQAGVRGAETTDAYLAALALEHNCQWWTTDSDFKSFPGLRYVNLLER